MAIPVVRVSLDLCVHSIIVVRLIRLHLRRMIVGVETCGVACDDADLLTVLVGTSRAMLLRVFQPVGSKQRGSVTLAASQLSALRYSRWELWTAEGVTAVVPTASRERVVAALELSGDLFVGRTSPRHEHHVEASKAENGNRQD